MIGIVRSSVQVMAALWVGARRGLEFRPALLAAPAGGWSNRGVVSRFPVCVRS
jgi:hypothetical protein